jgi:hypothetical protein
MKQLIAATRPLSHITKDITQTVSEFKRGQMSLGHLLLEARDHHFDGKTAGGFTDYVKKHVVNPLTGETPAIRTVENWMIAVRKILGEKKLTTSARRRADLNRASVSSQADPRKSPSHPDYKPRMNWQKTVGKVISGIDPEKLQRDYRDERKREEATQKLAKQIINAGYRALSAVCHPDKKGGSKEAFKALTDAKNWLTEAIND